ncbi:hypothetical protein F2P79_007937 [Pimephales promelas]|nr:hypothetical protein F2P79_007937 [Pimephales promelas]
MRWDGICTVMVETSAGELVTGLLWIYVIIQTQPTTSLSNVTSERLLVRFVIPEHPCVPVAAVDRLAFHHR